VPFLTFNALLAIQFGGTPNQDAFGLGSNFTLSSTAPAINPVTQPVTIQVGSFATTIPIGTNPTFARARDQSGKTKFARAKTRAKRPTKQPVDLIDDDHIDLARLDIGDQPFQDWPLHRAAGKPAIIIERRQHRPALVLLR